VEVGVAVAAGAGIFVGVTVDIGVAVSAVAAVFIDAVVAIGSGVASRLISRLPLATSRLSLFQ